MALHGEMPAQESAGRIADAQLPDQSRIMNSALTQIAERLGIVFQLLLKESSRLLK